mgnify:CR=1 FL=1
MRFLYIIYQICIGGPIFLVATILTALTTMLGCWLGNGHFWGYYPGKLWSQLTCFLFSLPVNVKGMNTWIRKHPMYSLPIIKVHSISFWFMDFWGVTSNG